MLAFLIGGGALTATSSMNSDLCESDRGGFYSTNLTAPAVHWSASGSYFVDGYSMLYQSNVSSADKLYSTDANRGIYSTTPYHHEATTWLGQGGLAMNHHPAHQDNGSSQPCQGCIYEDVAASAAVPCVPDHQKLESHAVPVQNTAGGPPPLLPLAPVPAPAPAPVPSPLSAPLPALASAPAPAPLTASPTSNDTTNSPTHYQAHSPQARRPSTARPSGRRRTRQAKKPVPLVFKSENETARNSVSGSSFGASASIKESTADKSCTSTSDKPVAQQSRLAHNSIERKYRMNLNKKLSELKAAVPSLKGAGEDGGLAFASSNCGLRLRKVRKQERNLQRDRYAYVTRSTS